MSPSQADAPDALTEPLYKLLLPGGTPAHGGKGVWPLALDGEPGAWLEVEGNLVPCHNGLHLARARDILRWAARKLYRAEYEGEIVVAGDKVVVRRARLLYPVRRWNDQVLRLFAADCATRVLPLYENEHPGDERPRVAIEAARHYAEGTGTQGQMVAAANRAWEASWGLRSSEAAREAVTSAATAAFSWASDISEHASDAAANAGWEPAWLAASEVARQAALAAEATGFAAGMKEVREAERAWQTQFLMQVLGEPPPAGSAT